MKPIVQEIKGQLFLIHHVIGRQANESKYVLSYPSLLPRDLYVNRGDNIMIINTQNILFFNICLIDNNKV